MKKNYRPRLSMTLWFTVLLFVENLIAVGIATASATAIHSIIGEDIAIAPEILVFLFSLVLGVSLSLLSNKFFLAPIRKLNSKMGLVAKGDFSVRVEENSRVKEIDNIYQNFNLMVKELGALEIIQSDFVANVSHEFKTPLSAIEGYSMLLQGTKNISEEQTHYIEKILFNTRRMSSLVGNILLLAKLDNQTIQTKKSKFRIDEQIRQSIMLQEISWVEKDLNLDVDLDAIEFYGTEELLLHVWNNLIGNAIKFSPNGQTVAITLKKNNGGLIFEVSDKGLGINDDAIAHIFDKFYQADSAHKEEGNGLGLALVKRIVDINGGTIGVKNKTDGGCSFKVNFVL